MLPIIPTRCPHRSLSRQSERPASSSRVPGPTTANWEGDFRTHGGPADDTTPPAAATGILRPLCPTPSIPRGFSPDRPIQLRPGPSHDPILGPPGSSRASPLPLPGPTRSPVPRPLPYPPRKFLITSFLEPPPAPGLEVTAAAARDAGLVRPLVCPTSAEKLPFLGVSSAMAEAGKQRAPRPVRLPPPPPPRASRPGDRASPLLSPQQLLAPSALFRPGPSAALGWPNRRPASARSPVQPDPGPDPDPDPEARERG